MFQKTKEQVEGLSSSQTSGATAVEDLLDIIMRVRMKTGQPINSINMNLLKVELSGCE